MRIIFTLALCFLLTTSPLLATDLCPCPENITQTCYPNAKSSIQPLPMVPCTEQKLRVIGDCFSFFNPDPDPIGTGNAGDFGFANCCDTSNSYFYNGCDANTEVTASGKAYAWAKNQGTGQSAFDGQVTNLHDFWTECCEGPGHVSTPAGQSQTKIISFVGFYYNLTVSGGSGIMNAAASGTASLITGKTIDVTLTRHVTGHQSSTRRNGITVDVSAGATGSHGDVYTVGQSQSASAVFQSLVTQATNAGLGGSFQYENIVEEQTSQQGVPPLTSQLVTSDQLIIRTDCHGSHEQPIENLAVQGLAQATSNTEDEVISTASSSLRGSIVNVFIRMPLFVCGAVEEFAIVDGAPVTPLPGPGGWSPPAEPIPGGSTDGGSKGASDEPRGLGPGGVGTGIDGQGSSVPEPGGQAGAALAEFSISVGPVEVNGVSTTESTETVHLSISSGSAVIDQNKRAYATHFASGGKIDKVVYFDAAVPLELSEGPWILSVPLSCTTPGKAEVALSFESNFPPLNTAYSAVEFVPMPFTVDSWGVGVHTGFAYFEEVPGVDLRTQRIHGGEVLSLKPLWDSGWAKLKKPTLEWEQVEGAGELVVPPTLIYNKAAGNYQLRVAATAPVVLDCNITIGEYSLSVPIEVGN